MKRILTLLLVFCSVQLFAINYVWMGTGNWSTITNWTPNGLPGLNDSVYFEGAGTCNLDVNVIVAHFEFDAGFSGVFNQNAFSINVNTGAAIAGMRAMVLNGTGTFNGSDQNITLGRIPAGSGPFPVNSFVLNGATFNSTSDTFTIQGDFRFLAGTFNHNNGWVKIRGTRASGGPANNITGQNPTFNSLELEAFDRDLFRLDVAMDVTVLDTLLKSSPGVPFVSGNMIMDGDILLKGDFLITYVQSNATGTWQGNARIYMNGAGAQRMVGRQATFSWNNVENIYIDKAPTDTLYLHNYINAGADWHYLGGVIDPGASTVYFFGTNGVSVDSITGTHTLYNVRFGALSRLGRKVIEPTDVITVSNELIFDGNNTADVYSGTIDALGNITVAGGLAVMESFCGGDATVRIKGTGNQLLHGQTQRNIGFLPNIVIDKPSGTLTLRDTINLEGNWTYIRGTAEAVLENSYVNFVYNGDNSTPDAIMTIDGEGTSATMLFNNVGIDNPPLGTQIRRNLGGDLRINGSLDIGSHLLTMNGNDLFIENENTDGIRSSGGRIIGETDLSHIHWFIGNAQMGTQYTFPFGTANSENVGIEYTVQTAGFQTGIGAISFATYPTDAHATPSNRPLPPGVANMDGPIGNDNSARELDRFWIYDCNGYATVPTSTLLLTYRDEEWNTGTNSIDESLLAAHQWNAGTSVWGPPLIGSQPAFTLANTVTVGNVNTCGIFTLQDPTFADLIITASDTVACPWSPVTFSEIFTAAPVAQTWVFPGGTPSFSTAANPVVTYSLPGVYDVILSSTYPGGMLIDTFVNYIRVTTPVVVNGTVTDALCGSNTGSINLTVTGGTPPYLYQWSTGNTAQDHANLTAGQYFVTVTDAFGSCMVVDTFVVGQGTPLTFTLNLTQPANCAPCDGVVEVNLLSGRPPIDILWAGGVISDTVIAGLCPGAYPITILDQNNCSDTATVVMQQPGNLAVSVHKTDVVCAGSNDGAAGAIATGGVPPYNYTWSAGLVIAPGDSVFGLAAGLVSVTVTDSIGCSAEASATINELLNLTITNVISQGPSCNGGSDGFITLNVTGGSPPYLYTWDNGSGVGNTLLGLSAGAYSITAADVMGCSDTVIVTLQEPTPLVVTGVVTDAVCGQMNGAINITVTGGTMPATYTWSHGTTTQDATGLAAGTYRVTVMDGNGCTSAATFTVNSTNSFTTTATSTNTSSCSACNGTASVVANTVAPVTYLWSNSSIGDSLTGLCAGTYNYTVTDTTGCPTTGSVTLSADTNFTLTHTFTQATCDSPFATMTLYISGATPPFIVDWNDGQFSTPSDSVITHFYSIPAVYTVTVTDSFSCTRTVTDTLRDVSINLTWEEVIRPVCTTNNGKLQAAGADGVPPYTYLWNTGATTDSIENLLAGTYTVTVTDSAGCSEIDSYTLVVTNMNLSVSTSVFHSDCGIANGMVIAYPTNGTPPYSISWNTGSTNDSIINLTAGTYSVTVTDSFGCTASTSVQLISLSASLNVATSIVSTNCTYGTLGSATLTPTNGTAPYTYQWNTGFTGQTLQAAAGSYSYTVTDSNFCSKTGSLNIPHVSVSNFSVYVSATLPNCTTPGTLTAGTYNSPLGPFTYLWNTTPPQTTQTATVSTAGIYTVTVTSASGCARTGSYNLTSNCKNVIRGTLFHDPNGNCIQDIGEPSIPYVNVSASKNGITSAYSNTNVNGLFNIAVPDSGTYLLNVTLTGGNLCGTFRVCDPVSEVTFTSLGDTSFNNNLGLTGAAQFDLRIVGTSGTANPGFNKTYSFNAYNQSTVPFSDTATVRFVYDGNLTYQSATVAPYSHDAVSHVLTWKITNVPQQYLFADRVNITFHVPATMSLNDQLLGNLYIAPSLGDCDLSDNQWNLATTVQGAIDPNEKQVSPPGPIIETDSILTYTIHFQNTGTDTTHFVVLRDTLSEYLDPGTVEPIASSHPYSEFTLSEDGILMWLFNPIYLPDSFTNEEESKGWVMFSIKKRSNLAIGTEIPNKVSIYFDYAQPIVTNTVKSMLIDPDWVFEPGENHVTVYAVPNPFSELTRITVEGVQKTFDFTLYNMMGMQCAQIPSVQTNSFELRRNDLPPGIYFYRITEAGKVLANGKLVVAR